MKEQSPDTSESSLPPDWVRRKLAQLQKELAEFGQIPVGVDQLHRFLAEAAATSSKEKEFERLLSLIINDTLKGIDISRRYPAFFEEMVTDIVLRESFLDALEILELGRAGELEPVPGDFSHDLSFLYRQAPQPVVEMVESGRWRVIWQLTVAQIASLFIAAQRPNANATYRGTYNWLDDDRIILIRDIVTIDEESYEILLEATRPVDGPEQLNLSLLVATERPTPAAIQAYIQWGSYKTSLMLNEYGLGRFPPVLLSTILDEAGNKIVADLQLKLTYNY